MTYELVEMFYSIQGEGANVGRPTIFIRLAGCSYYCEFCDTNRSTKMEATEEEITEYIGRAFPSGRYVCVTGGEPTEQDILPLLKRLKRFYGPNVSMETNGHYLTPAHMEEAWITLSPKKKEDLHRRVGPYDYSPRKFKLAHELKFLVGDGHDLWATLNLQELQQHSYCYLQPVWGPNYGANLKEAIRLVKDFPSTFRLSIQTQKYINVM